MRSHLFTGREVGVNVALLEPRVVVCSEAVRGDLTRFLAVFYFLEFPKDLSAAFDVETLVHCDRLSYRNSSYAVG